MKLSELKPSRRIQRAQRPSRTVLLVDLQAMRLDRGVTLRQVQTALGVNNAVLCQVEHGCTPSLETALRLAAFVELPIEKIWALKKGSR
jgi:DNA-binding XRE family transcriptional regulator